MRKNFLFAVSIAIAFGITLFIKSEKFKNSEYKSAQWKTFIKKSGADEIVAHKTTAEEFEAANIKQKPLDEAALNGGNGPSRSIASVSPTKGFMVRKDRILMGEIDQRYEDEDTPLTMTNKINPDWKEIMGRNLMRFQPEETKIMVKEEVPVIKIEEGAGRYLQQVTITYLKKDGFKSSFKALVDSDTGSVIETWDRSIYEEVKRTRGGLTLPSVNESGIITK